MLIDKLRKDCNKQVLTKFKDNNLGMFYNFSLICITIGRNKTHLLESQFKHFSFLWV